MEEYFEKQKQQQEAAKPPEPSVFRLFYRPDGTLIKLSDEIPQDGDLYMEVNEQEFRKKHDIANIFLRVIDGKIVNIKQRDPALQTQLVPGDTWHADEEQRLIVGEPSVNTSGWSRKTD